MKSALEDLWYGNICPSTDCYELSNESRKLVGYIANHHENLTATLNETQRKIFEKFNECNSELSEINDREIFLYAFRLGARMAIEVIGIDNTGEI